VVSTSGTVILKPSRYEVHTMMSLYNNLGLYAIG